MICKCIPKDSHTTGDAWQNWTSTTARLLRNPELPVCNNHLNYKNKCWHKCSNYNTGSIRALVQTPPEESMDSSKECMTNVEVVWRRQDINPLNKGFIVVGACSGKQTQAWLIPEKSSFDFLSL